MMQPDDIAESISLQLAEKERVDLDQLGRAQTGGPMRELTSKQQFERGCHCWNYRSGELVFQGYVITCPFHGLPFEALVANKSPEQIERERKIVKENGTLAQAGDTSESRP